MTTRSTSRGRRCFLRAAGITLALPILESVRGTLAGTGIAWGMTAESTAAGPRRLVCIGNMLGFYPPAFFPEQTGREFTLSTELQPLSSVREHITLFSGLDHGVKGGHFAIHAFLSGVQAVDAKSMPEGNITLDQRAAELVGGATRFPSLTIGSEDGIHGGCQMSWTRSGTRVPPIPGPNELFHKLFINDTAEDKLRAADRLKLQGSILDAVLGDAQSLQRRLNQRDKEKLDEYFSSVRDVERQLELGRQWNDIPKPEAGMKEPDNKEMVSDLPVLYDLMALAIRTDSTRVATLEIAGDFRSSAFGFKKDYHALSHHGQVQESIDALIKMETYQIEQFARFLETLRGIPEGDGTLLDHTMVLFGSGMGNANSHTNTNLPIILAGGGFQHGEHKAYPTSGLGRQPLCNLYLSLLQRFGVETDHFGTSTSTLTDLA